MAFTEFYADASAGSNLNSGDTAGAVEVTALAGTYNRGTGAGGTDRFTAASGTPFSGISAGRFVAIKAAGGSAPADFLGRITAVNGGGASIDISLTAISGTRPADAASVDARVGGAWKGPNGASGFPFGTVANTLTNASGDLVRTNFKNNATYSITASITANVAGGLRWEGYSSSAGDGGKATIDGGTSGASYILLNVSQNIQAVVNFILANNGASGSADGLTVGGGRCLIQGVVVHDVRGNGINCSGGPNIVDECEAYNCNQSNTANLAGINGSSAGGKVSRCISHDNTGSNSLGFRGSVNAMMTYIRCIADSNGSHGFSFNGNEFAIDSCDAYNNGGAGINLNSGGDCVVGIENCNLVKNAGYGIAGSTLTGDAHGYVRYCGFGSGTQANTSGTTNGLKSVAVSGSVTYASDVTPWVDPANGDFRINLAAAKGTGRGTFTQTAASYSGTVGYPDIGAAQSQGGGGGTIIGSSIIRGAIA